MKIFDFCKKFSPKNQKETSVGQILSVLSDEISKWRNLSDYRTMRYLFFLHVRRFSGAAFFQRARTRMRAYARPHTPVQRMRIYSFIIGARRTEFQLSAFYDCFAELFIRRAPKKQNCGIFGEKKCRSLQNSGKKREIRLETAKKRLLAAIKGRYSSERTVKRRKKGEKEKKRKKIKKF